MNYDQFVEQVDIMIGNQPCTNPYPIGSSLANVLKFNCTTPAGTGTQPVNVLVSGIGSLDTNFFFEYDGMCDF